MNQKHLWLFFAILLTALSTQSQVVSSYRWKNRVLMVMSEDPGSALVKRQMTLFAGQSEELKERKLIVLQVFPTHYLMGSDNFVRRENNELYFEYKTKEIPFEVILIGLDGGLKFQRSTIITPSDLYTIIDAMPMRRAERN
jgi:hypothetical protein